VVRRLQVQSRALLATKATECGVRLGTAGFQKNLKENGDALPARRGEQKVGDELVAEGSSVVPAVRQWNPITRAQRQVSMPSFPEKQ
jgi:hypothetical protein